MRRRPDSVEGIRGQDVNCEENELLFRDHFSQKRNSGAVESQGRRYFMKTSNQWPRGKNGTGY